MGKAYIVVEATAPYHLEASVNANIDKGYEPVGGVSLHKNKYGPDLYIQAMFKRPPTEPTKHYDI